MTGQREGMLWNPGSRLPWRQRICLGKDIRWNECTPAQILLDPGKTYAIQYTLNACVTPPAKGPGTILLRQSSCGAFTDTLPLHVPMEDLACGPRTLQYAAVLYPRAKGGAEVSVSLALEARNPLCVERAVLDVVEL